MMMIDTYAMEKLKWHHEKKLNFSLYCDVLYQLNVYVNYNEH